MKNFIEITTEILGSQICEILAPDSDYNFGRLANTMIDAEGKTFYEYEGQKISLTDTETYQAFHLFRSNINVRKGNSQIEKFYPFSGLKSFSVPLTFLLFGWTETKGKEWDLLQLFSGEYHRINNGETELTANISFENMSFSPAAVIRKYFLSDWPNVAQKQGHIVAFEINYTAVVSSCKYCFE